MEIGQRYAKFGSLEPDITDMTDVTDMTDGRTDKLYGDQCFGVSWCHTVGENIWKTKSWKNETINHGWTNGQNELNCSCNIYVSIHTHICLL